MPTPDTVLNVFFCNVGAALYILTLLFLIGYICCKLLNWIARKIKNYGDE